MMTQGYRQERLRILTNKKQIHAIEFIYLHELKGDWGTFEPMKIKTKVKKAKLNSIKSSRLFLNSYLIL